MSDAGTQNENLQKALAEKLAPFVGRTLGLAVSGGSDSRALLELAVDWARETDSKIVVATVDHGLRKEARKEAEDVAAICAQISVPHDILVWEGWNGQGNLQAEARRARYHLIADWAIGGGAAGVAIGHTADDVAETFLMRISRTAGVDGLAHMRGEFERDGMRFVRPLLATRRALLRQYLRERNVTWLEDPSNQDSRFERVKMRSALQELEIYGVGVEKITQAAKNLKLASTALKSYAAKEAERVFETEDGDLLFDPMMLKTTPEDIQRRLLIGAVLWMSAPEYPPRFRALSQLISTVLNQGASTLAGCVFTIEANRIRVSREFSAVEEDVSPLGADRVEWDNRWLVSGQFPHSARVGALGENGLVACPDWRETGRKRRSLLASPSVWVGSELLAAPLAQKASEFAVTPMRSREDLSRILLSH